MIYWFKNFDNLDLIDIWVEFKLRFKVFIVNVISYFENIVEGNMILYVEEKLEYNVEV